jgi:hypothetical protein
MLQVAMPKGAKVVHVAVQNKVICFWAMVNPKREKEVRSFQWVGTGWAIPRGAVHLGSTLGKNGSVWHVFELVPTV